MFKMPKRMRLGDRHWQMLSLGIKKNMLRTCGVGTDLSKLVVSVFIAAGALVAASCARVNPKADYQRAAEMIAQRTGTTETFLPDAPDPAEEKVTQLLRGKLTVQTAVQIALVTNPDFQALFDQIGASRADVVQSGLMANPTMSLTMIWPEGGGRPKIVYNFLQDIVDLWQIPVKKKIAQDQLEQVVHSVVHKGIDIATETRIACYKYIAARRAERISHEDFDFVKASLKDAQRSGDQKGRGVDVKRVQALMLVAQVSMLNADRELRTARAALGRIMGVNRRPDIWEVEDDLPKPPAEIEDEKRLLDYAMDHRMDAKALSMQIEAGRGQIQRQMLAMFPRVVIGPAGEQKDTRGVPERNIFGDILRTSVAKGTLAAPSVQSRDQRHFAKSQIIDALTGAQIQATLPLWDQNQAQVAKAEFALRQKQKEYDALMNAITQDVQQAVATVQVALQLARLYESDIIPQGDVNVAAAQKAYDSGEQSITALLEAKRFVVTQRQAEVAVMRDAAVALANLERAVGGRLPSDGPTPTTKPAN